MSTDSKGTSTASEVGTKLAVRTGNNGPRVPALGECTKVLVLAVGQDWWGFGGIKGASEAVEANSKLEPIQTANGCSHRVAIFKNKQHGDVVKSLWR